ncbi:hypothetical protein [Effusibacillus lacus]|uniref:Nitroreductase n=2 Tax=Effusibacillus lacus TaxID=1348429 RepID=A0A292YM44_9BACL|nr:hypothetical protein [Effusibacillus lacus]TCS72280.1 hypothetical protein EDD64_12233 [Effusibacillus lacus]GAX90246.1 nitroreductase [Effusibacillus lacus]
MTSLTAKFPRHCETAILPNIPDEKLEDLLQEPVLKRLTPFPKPMVAHLVNFYKENRTEGESFHAFVKRVGVPAFQAKLDEFLAVSA